MDTLRALRTPLSPAFTLLGITPVAVERPSTPRAFAVAVFSATENLTQLPENLALEVAPYWLRPHPDLEYDAYYRPDVLSAVRQTLSFSVAIVRRDSLIDATDIGFGLRLQPWPGQESSISQQIRAEISKVQEQVLRTNRELNAARARQNQSQIEQLSDSLTKLANSIRTSAQELQLHQERVGLQVQLAGGWAGRFPQQDFDQARTFSLGAWATAAYRWEEPKFEAIALTRLVKDRATDNQSLLDAGVRVVWEMPKLALSAEAVGRFAGSGEPGPGPEVENSGRLAANIDYRLKDDMYVYLTLGRDHKRAGSDEHPLLALLGLSLEFGDRPRLLR